MIKKVTYADWPENQIMLECIQSASVGISVTAGTEYGLVCLKEGECTCLASGAVLPEDKKQEDESTSS